MADISEHIIRCCDDLGEAIEDTFIRGVDNMPLKIDIPIPPTVYIFNDSGRAGCYQIEYCPFCGKKLKFDY